MKHVDVTKRTARAARAPRAPRVPKKKNTKRSGLDSKHIYHLIETLFKSGKKSYWSIWKSPQPGDPITIRSEEIEIIIRKRRPPGILYTIDNEGKIIGYCD